MNQAVNLAAGVWGEDNMRFAFSDLRVAGCDRCGDNNAEPRQVPESSPVSFASSHCFGFKGAVEAQYEAFQRDKQQQWSVFQLFGPRELNDRSGRDGDDRDGLMLGLMWSSTSGRVVAAGSIAPFGDFYLVGDRMALGVAEWKQHCTGEQSA